MSNTIRFTGLSSGLDTESIVKAIMRPYQNKVETFEKNKILADWKKDAYKEMSNKIQDFRNNALEKIQYASSLNESKATVSKEGYIKIDTGSYKEDGVHRIEVKELAKAAAAETKAIKSKDGTKLTSDSKVSDIEGMGDSGSFKINGVEVSFDENTTIKELETQVTEGLKAQGNEDVSFKFDNSVGAFLINSKTTGASQEITLEDTDGTLANLGITKGTAKGSNAVVVYNDGLTIESETNDIEVNGVKFTALAKTTEAITVSVTKDVDEMVKAVSNFVSEYNKLLEEMDGKLSAGSAKGYSPLTEEEKDAMTDKEIELWENKIKGSLLSDDSTLKDIYGSLRGIMNADHSGKDGIEDGYSMLSQIGISSSGWKDKGKLTVDEDKLREAIKNNGDGVVNLVNKIGTEMSKELDTRSKSTELRSYGQYFNDKVQTQNISRFEKEKLTAQARYDRLENMYYKKFTAMEQAMQQMNSQSSMFMGM